MPDARQFVNQDPIGLQEGRTPVYIAYIPSARIDFLGLTGTRDTQTGPNILRGTITGFSTGEGGKGITHPVVHEACDR